MLWSCKYCEFSCDKRGYLLRHYRLKHGGYSRTVPFPCLYKDCPCTFNSINSLNTHLSRIHKDCASQPQEPVQFSCQLCDFVATCTDDVFFKHLRSTHLKVHHKVICPFNGCNFESSVYSTFNVHMNREHKEHNWRMFKPAIVSSINDNVNVGDNMLNDATIEHCEDDDGDPNDDYNDLEKQLEENLALLFLKMETILHIPQRSIQEVIEQFLQINALSKPLLQKSVNDILKQHMVDNNAMVGQLVTAITNTNAIGRFCGKGGSLSTNKRRETYQNRTFPVVQPVEFIIDRFKKDSAVYVPLNAMLQVMLNKTDIINKALEVPQSLPHEYLTYRNGSHYTNNEMFQGDGFKISLGLYIDDFEVSNPLGTSKKKHKMTAIYWVIANLPYKDRSTLHSIQLALLCKAAHVKQHGYEKILEPLLKDLISLEQQGVYVDKLGSFVKGTVLYVAADNLASHSLAGFFESFGVERFCRFCMASRHEIQEKEMAASEKMTMRVIFSESDIRKLTLETRPTTTEDLKSMLQVSLGLQYSFDLQFQDPEFSYELCNLTDVSDLPDKPTLKIIPLLELSLTESSALSEGHHSSADTESLSVSSMERQEPWPFIFDIPNFSVDVEYRLRQADLEHLQDGSVLKKVPKDMKHEILEKIAEHMYGYTAYPTSQQYESVAKSLISKHPCLREIGSASGCSGWKNSITCKMANYRRKRSRSGCRDVTVNAGKRGRHTQGDSVSKQIKKPRKGELNFLPNFPDGFDETKLEQARTEMEDEMKKKTPNGRLIKQNMDLTFALRRNEVVETAPPISHLMKRWPALFTNEQIRLEFKRIVGKDLQQEFYSAFDDHTTRLMEIFKAKRGNVGEHLAQLLQQMQSLDPTEKRTVTLRGLPHLLGDNPTEFFKSSFDGDESFGQMDIGILLVNPESVSPPASDLHPASLKIVIEGEVVVEKLSTLPEAVSLLFGLTYGLHLNYPKKIRNTFQFIQQVFFSLGSTELKPRIQTLKNQLLV